MKKVYGVITTHYSNLKMFAFKAKGIVNGAMHFDKDSHSSTYELKLVVRVVLMPLKLQPKPDFPKKC
ncbi:MAG: hypothetical protein R2769_04195 [Saprospiraceae bacterium]